MWNFHLGVCMNSFETNCTILSLTFTGFHIYAAGTSKVVIDLFDNGAESVDPVMWDKRHGKTIVSLDCYGHDLLASASPDGEIIVWFRRSADAKIQIRELKGILLRKYHSFFFFFIFNARKLCIHQLSYQSLSFWQLNNVLPALLTFIHNTTKNLLCCCCFICLFVCF